MPVPDCHHVTIDFLPLEETLDTRDGGFVYLPVPGTRGEVQAQFSCMWCCGVVMVIVAFVLIFTL